MEKHIFIVWFIVACKEGPIFIWTFQGFLSFGKEKAITL